MSPRPASGAAFVTALLAFLSVWFGVGACSADSTPSTTRTAASPPAGLVTGTVTVLAASSLQQSFTTLARRFESANPGSVVVLSFGGSSTLAAQLVQGAPADVFAAASVATMAQVVKAGRVSAPMTFATNTMMIAVPATNPGQVAHVTDLARPGLKVVLCQATVPCGAAARMVLDTAGVTVTAASLEADVKAVLTKVSLAEADAAIVYVTDVAAAGAAVTGIAIPAATNTTTSYPLATVLDSTNPVAAQAFVHLVLSSEGRQVLSSAGFGVP
jgi:molybdate transport system substrate-binding protein